MANPLLPALVLTLAISTLAWNAHGFDIPTTSNTPCSEGQFVWDGDFQCHNIAECGTIGVDRDSMIAYNEDYHVAPAQPCRCVDPTRYDTITDDPGLLPGNCGMCKTFAPDGYRSAAYVGQEYPAQCEQAPRGDPYYQRHDVSRVSLSQPMPNDFFCWTPDNTCWSSDRRTSDRHWRDTQWEDFQAEVWGRLSTDTDTFAVVSLQGYCGRLTDWSQSIYEGTCVCTSNTAWANSVFVRQWDKDENMNFISWAVGSPNSICKRCDYGYKILAGDMGDMCVKKPLTCPTAEEIPFTSHWPSGDPRASTTVARCLPIDVACNHPASTSINAFGTNADKSATIDADACVYADQPAFGGFGLIPNHEDLGLQIVLRICNTAEGYFTNYFGEFYSYCGTAAQLNPRHGFGTGFSFLVVWYIKWIFMEFLPVGVAWTDRFSVNPLDYWSDPPLVGIRGVVPSEVWWTFQGTQYSNTEDFMDIAIRVWTDPGHDDVTDELRAQFVWMVCGLAAAPPPLLSEDSSPPGCTCIPHATMDAFPSIAFLEAQGSSLSRGHYAHNGCMCEEGYVYDRDTHVCREALEFCGPGVDVRFRFTCVCKDLISKDAQGRCTACDAGRFRPLDGCPLVAEVCETTDAGFDVDTTTSTNECSCRSGFRTYTNQAGPRNGCYTCANTMWVPSRGDPTTCGPVETVCPEPFGAAQGVPQDRVDEEASFLQGTCVCKRGWTHEPHDAFACVRIPDGEYFVSQWTDEALPLSYCGDGRSDAMTTADRWCQCDTARGFMEYSTMPEEHGHDPNPDCSLCVVGSMYDLQDGDCHPAEEVCGAGVDIVASFSAEMCVCQSSFLGLADQPSGKCFDCAPGLYRSMANVSSCQPLPAAMRIHAGKARSVQEWERLMDRAVVDGSGVFDEGVDGACGVRWSWTAGSSSLLSDAHILATGTTLFKPVGYSVEEAKYACHHFYPCRGVVVSLYNTEESVQLYRFVYLARADTPSVGWAPFATATTEEFRTQLQGVWSIARHHGTVCHTNTVDPAWYWQTWSTRLAEFAMHVPPIHTSAATRFPNSAQQAMIDPLSVQHHFWWVGHLARLAPNPQCLMAPLPASARDGCRSQTCPYFDACPVDFPAALDEFGLCVQGEGFASGSGTTPTVITAYDAWPNSTVGLATLEGGTHPEMCNQGMCAFDMDTGDTEAFVCACPLGFTGGACNTVFTGQLVDASLTCGYPLAPSEFQLCSGETGYRVSQPGLGCAPGFVGDHCEFLDVDQYCHTISDAGEWSAECSGHGSCGLAERQGVQQLACSCDNGWSGAACEVHSCPDDCGPFGYCVATTQHGITQTRCVCAVHQEDLSTPLAMLDVNGRCTIDLCNDHDGDHNRYGTLTLASGGATNHDGAPLGSCACYTSPSGLRNSGPFCDQTQCANACGMGLAFDAHATLRDQTCVLCASIPTSLAHRCDAGDIGAVCDCTVSYAQEGTQLHNNKYWTTLPVKFVDSPTTPGQCVSACHSTQVWNHARQQCVCANDQMVGEACDTPGCPLGVFDPYSGLCTSCDPHVVLHVGRCESCDEGYLGDHCEQCAHGFVRSDDGEACVPCEEGLAGYCFGAGTSTFQCADGTPQCTCAEGYTGATCDTCMEGFWRLTPARMEFLRPDVANNATGICAPVSDWTFCDAGGEHVEAVVAPGGDNPPQCICRAGWSNTTRTIVGVASYARNVEDPGNCQVCVEGHVQVHGQCLACADTLHCDAPGTAEWSCPNPGEGTPFSTGDSNRCVCDIEHGRTGARCDQCNTATKWVRVPNSDPMACMQCARDCGPNGEVMCGINLETCRCKGGWSGPDCDICTYCGHGGSCAPASHEGPEWCLCDSHRGYARDKTLAQSPDYYKALCTSCIDGFFMQGIVCRSISEACGPGADGSATKHQGRCVCKEGFLPIHQQPSGTCSVCATTHISVNATQCTTCDPGCPQHAQCKWDMATRRPSCICQEGFALDGHGQCSMCATGYLGPTCQPCSTECTQSGGACAWNADHHRQECVCPPGTTHTLEGNAQSGCRPCHPTDETPTRCLLCPTCPDHSSCTEPANVTSTLAECGCDEGFARPLGANPYLSRCAPPSELSELAPPNFHATTIQGKFDTVYLMSGLVLGTLVLGCVGCIMAATTLQRRWVERSIHNKQAQVRQRIARGLTQPLLPKVARSPPAPTSVSAPQPTPQPTQRKLGIRGLLNRRRRR